MSGTPRVNRKRPRGRYATGWCWLRGILICGAITASCCAPPEPSRGAFRFLENLPLAAQTFGPDTLSRLRTESHLAAPVTLRDETRQAVTPPLTSSLSFTADVQPDSELRFALGVGSVRRERFPPIHFRVLLRSEAGSDVIFQETVSFERRNQWLDRGIEMGTWAGLGRRLVLETRPDAAAADGGASPVPLWANPALVDRRCCTDRPNVILISIDCMRADHVGAYGYPKHTTPNIDAFARDGTVFEQAISAAPSTFPSHTSMLTGVTPLHHKGNTWERRSPAVPYLPEILADAGYAVHGVTTGAYLAQSFGFETGFHVYRFLHRASASETVDAALDLLRLASGQSLFLLVHFIDAHWPYSPPHDVLRRFGPIPPERDELLAMVRDDLPPRRPDDVEAVRRLYDGEIAYVDDALGRFFAELRSMGLYEPSLILLTADHGDAFYEHGGWQHNRIHEEVIHVPLIAKWPEKSRRRRIASPVSLVDIFPTVLEAAGLDPPESMGISLARHMSGDESTPRRVVITDLVSRSADSRAWHIAIRLNDLKYVAQLTSPADRDPGLEEVSGEMLYDLGKDPGESRNLVAEAPAVMDFFRRELRRHLITASLVETPGEIPEPDEITKERLRSLGYLR